MTNDVAARATNAAIRAEMARRQLRQSGLAEALNISQAQVSARLNGHIDWKLAELRALAALFGLPLTELVDATPVAETGSANPAFLLVPPAVAVGLCLPYSFGTSVGVLVASIGVVAGLGIRGVRGRRDRVVEQVEARAAAVAHRRILGGAR